ncbi:uncharacterized protein LOC107870998 isoform X2 [Capsicum annuum]|uniref:uncharacterized protein LOC107870998 isoform X2 n=1 Tax=Capsicum annuum TaxID=4072 RepID=UPI0007BEFAAB|nr:uncharacterized protein LOC107870998 isoform X2 [Capsicum annuum]
MEQLKVQINQMIEQLKQRSVGRSTVDPHELIGKLEQAKSYLFAEAIRGEPLMGMPPISPTTAHAAASSMVSLPRGVLDMTDPILPLPATLQPPLAPRFAEFQVPPPLPQQPPLNWDVTWGSTDEQLFVPVNNFISYWFTTVVANLEAILVDQDCYDYLRDNSPTYSFINSPYVGAIGIPVTIMSRELHREINPSSCPGLLSRTHSSEWKVFWPSLGTRFYVGLRIRLSYQWKRSGSKYMLFIFIDNEADGSYPIESHGAGPSNRDVRHRMV